MECYEAVCVALASLCSWNLLIGLNPLLNEEMVNYHKVRTKFKGNWMMHTSQGQFPPLL